MKIIDLCILRLKKTKLANKIYLCTTKNKEDDKFIKVCKEHKINIFRGSENDVLKRLIDCAKKNSIKTIVRITGDCPITDPNLIDKCLRIHFKNNIDYTTNTLKLSFPDGLDVEVIESRALTKSFDMSKNLNNKEHVTPFIRKSNVFSKKNIKSKYDYSDRRWTLDYYKDYIFIKKVYKYFSPNLNFSWKRIISAEKFNKNLINIKKRCNE